MNYNEKFESEQMVVSTAAVIFAIPVVLIGIYSDIHTFRISIALWFLFFVLAILFKEKITNFFFKNNAIFDEIVNDDDDSPNIVIKQYDFEDCYYGDVTIPIGEYENIEDIKFVFRSDSNLLLYYKKCTDGTIELITINKK